MSEKELAEKTLTANMVDVHVQLYEPFYNFMKEYLAFFGSEKAIEDLCRDMIYECVKFLYNELEEFADGDFRHLEKSPLFKKWPHIACAAFDEKDEEETA